MAFSEPGWPESGPLATGAGHRLARHRPRWRRRRFREYWTRLSRRQTGGRPPLDAEIAALIRRMAAANPLWGAPRIHGELLKLGIAISERTVSRLMRKSRPRPSQTWRTFLANHIGDLVSIDLFTVPTARLRVLFVLVLLAHHRRRVVHFNVTEQPTAAWTAQQLVEAFPEESAPAYLLRDRDRYSFYYHQARTHLALDKDAPDTRPVALPAARKIVQLPQVGGLHHRYTRQAA